MNKKFTQKELLSKIALVVVILLVVVGSLFIIKYRNPDAPDTLDNDSSYNYDPKLFQGTA